MKSIHLRLVSSLFAAAALAACSGGSGGESPPPVPQPPPFSGPAWPGFAGDAQHTAVSGTATFDLGRIAWTAPVDEAPQYTGNGSLLAHYGSPVVTSANNIVIPVKTGATGGFRVEARAGAAGTVLWSQATDYVLPPHGWVPSYNVVLSQNALYVPAAGGRLLRRGEPDVATGNFEPITFYGNATYVANAAAFNSSVYVSTPLTADAQGNVFFGFTVTGANPAGLTGGIARVSPTGQHTWVSASAAANDVAITKPALNSAPALSPDGSILYVAVNTPFVSNSAPQRGYLLALDSTTLAVRARIALTDPLDGSPARVTDNATSSPAVGSDGRVFFGVLEAVIGTHNLRGWLLQFDALLNPTGAPGSFGWDVTPTVIPASMVPAYNGTSPYLLALKYNNYAGRGTGDGLNRLAVLDPRTSQQDAFSSLMVMREVQTVLAPTADLANPGGRMEWCVNTMAADPTRRSVLVNNEDGILYRWDLATNNLSQSIRLSSGLGQAYTPTLVGADGAVYAISNARLYQVRN